MPSEAQTDKPRQPSGAGQRILMCAPGYFGVDYIINPWMEHQIGQTDRPLAEKQWAELHRHLAQRVPVDLILPQPGLPDMVFTANAGLAIGKTVVVSRFRYQERRPEEEFFRDWFRTRGFILAPWPEDIFFEGAGDALLDRGAPIIWCGYGQRSDVEAVKHLERIFDRESVGLRLIDPRFYHLDTCFCPLAGGWLLYFPGAFDEASHAVIARHVPKERRIAVGEEDALAFACNAVDLEAHVFLNDASETLQKQLERAGFKPVTVPLSQFLKSGGAAKCLTLKLVEP
ncbi:MAG TPA: arginine deiminase-related protein [Methylocella sp.]|nr:arginine deiminase-related protein [Methylocella sp.]